MPSSSVVVLTVLLCLGGAGWLGWLLVDDGSPAAADTAGRPSATTWAPATTTPTPTPEPSTTGPTEEAPTPSPDETTSEPAPARDVAVSVLNNSGIQGAAKAFSAKVVAAGWPLGGIGNWTGVIVANTVYYPAGLEEQARLLADDVDIDRVLPRVATMRPDRLTIILSGPQS